VVLGGDAQGFHNFLDFFVVCHFDLLVG